MAVTPGEGEQFEFIQKVAVKLNTYVVFGFIEKEPIHSKNGSVDWKLFNSAAVINRKGEIILVYRKTHLYYNDRLWAQ